MEDVLAVMQALRETERTTYDIAKRFLQIGVKFSAKIKVKKKGQEHLHRRIRPLGYRWRNYQGSAADYVAYENARDQFLQKREGRAVFEKGGILWRLGMEKYGADLAVNKVLGGIWREVAEEEGKALETSEGIYKGDEMTEEEISLVCGQYQVWTGKREKI